MKIEIDQLFRQRCKKLLGAIGKAHMLSLMLNKREIAKLVKQAEIDYRLVDTSTRKPNARVL